MENNEYQNVIQTAKKYGDKDNNFWLQVIINFGF